MRAVTFQTGVNILGTPTYITHLVTQEKPKYGRTVIKVKQIKHTQ